MTGFQTIYFSTVLRCRQTFSSQVLQRTAECRSQPEWREHSQPAAHHWGQPDPNVPPSRPHRMTTPAEKCWEQTINYKEKTLTAFWTWINYLDFKWLHLTRKIWLCECRLLCFPPAGSVGSRTPALCSIVFVQRQHPERGCYTCPEEGGLLHFLPSIAPVRLCTLGE